MEVYTAGRIQVTYNPTLNLGRAAYMVRSKPPATSDRPSGDFPAYGDDSAQTARETPVRPNAIDRQSAAATNDGIFGLPPELRSRTARTQLNEL
jgi:hypothetical protein